MRVGVRASEQRISNPEICPPEDGRERGIPRLLNAVRNLCAQTWTTIWAEWASQVQLRLKRKDGSAVRVLNSAIPTPGVGANASLISGTVNEVSDRTEVEHDNRCLAAIVRCSDDAILSTTLTGTIESWNPGAERIFGYSADEAIGRSIAIIAGGSELHKSVLKRVAEGQGVQDIQTTHTTKDGREIDVSISVSPVADAAGRIVRAAGIIRDVTDRKRAEQALRRSEAQYRLLFETSPIPMWVADRTTLQFLAVNTAAVRHYGFTEQEFLSMTILDIRPPEDVPAVLDHIAKRQRDRREIGPSRHRKKNGELIHVQVVGHDLNFHGKDAVLVAVYDVTEQKRAKEMLQESENRYRVLFEDSADAYWLMDEKGFVDSNSEALEMFGFSSKAEFKHPADVSPPCQADGTPSREAAERLMAIAFEKGKHRFEWLHQRRNGEVFPAEVCLSKLKLNGRPMLLATSHDISERKRTEDALLFKTALLEAQSETTIDGIIALDESNRIVIANRQFGLQFGIPNQVLQAGNERLVGEYVLEKIEDAEAFVQKSIYLTRHIEEKTRDELRFKDGRTFDIYSAPLLDSKSRHRGRIWYARDITARKTAEQRAEYLAYYDALTGLPNRALFEDRLRHAIAGARRRNENVALLFLDLDRFKLINDSLGHAVGDLILKEVANRLKACTREEDTVARIGGDEFVVVLNSVHGDDDASLTAERIVRSMRSVIEVHSYALSTSCSIGISMFPQHGVDGESLIKYADQAMYASKEKGRNNFQFFTEDLNDQAVERMNLERDLRIALERDEFFLVYQPQMKVDSGRIAGMEALIRWRNPALGLVSPEKFIPIVEQNGQILSIGEFVLRTACSQAQRWRAEGLLMVPISVNVSAIQIHHEGFCKLVRDILAETGLPPEYLELEITESLLLSSEGVLFSVLKELKDMGLKLAIDDFGTGYSNLSYLKLFRVNKLKIDRTFIRDLATDPDDASITSAIITMAKSLKVTVIAEGVETEEQLSLLRRQGCEEIQGYYFSRPVSASEMAAKLCSSPS